MATTLNSIAPIAHPERLFIGGEWVKPSSDSVFEVIAPATEELYLRVAEVQEADMNRAVAAARSAFDSGPRSEEHTSELQSLMRISYAVFCLKKKKPWNGAQTAVPTPHSINNRADYRV